MVREWGNLKGRRSGEVEEFDNGEPPEGVDNKRKWIEKNKG